MDNSTNIEHSTDLNVEIQGVEKTKDEFAEQTENTGQDEQNTPKEHVLRIVINKYLRLSKSEIEEDQFILGNLSTVPWQNSTQIVDGIAQILMFILKINTEDIERSEAFREIAPLTMAEVHLKIKNEIEKIDNDKITFGIRYYLTFLKDPDAEMKTDFESNVDEFVIDNVRQIAQNTISEIGGNTLSAPLSIVGSLVNGELQISGKLAKDPEAETDSEIFEIEGSWDGMHISKHIFFFLTQLENKKDKSSLEIKYDREMFEKLILDQKHGENDISKIEVKIRKKGKKEWYVFEGIKKDE